MTTTFKQAIDVYLLLGKNAKNSVAAKKLIVQAINDPNTYVFGELLELEVVNSIKGEKEHNLLLLFAYGTYMDFKKNPNNFPNLSTKNLEKLKKLTIVSLSSQNNSIRYEQLMQILEIKTTRELEDVLIDCMYTNLLNGKLDQKLKCLEVTSVMNRDVKFEDITKIQNKLINWMNRSNEIIVKINELGKKANDEFQKSKTLAEKHQKEVEKIEKNVKNFRTDDLDLPNDDGRRSRDHRDHRRYQKKGRMIN